MLVRVLNVDSAPSVLFINKNLPLSIESSKTSGSVPAENVTVVLEPEVEAVSVPFTPNVSPTNPFTALLELYPFIVAPVIKGFSNGLYSQLNVLTYSDTV